MLKLRRFYFLHYVFRSNGRTEVFDLTDYLWLTLPACVNILLTFNVLK